MASLLFFCASTAAEVRVVYGRAPSSEFSLLQLPGEIRRYRREQEYRSYLAALDVSNCDKTLTDEKDTTCSSIEAQNGSCPPVITMSPDLRYSCPLVQTAAEGHSFYIRGRVLKTCERFAIDLVLNNERKDIALHFNPRLPQNYVVRNSKVGGSWGDEERCSALPFLLHRDSTFLVQILVTKQEYLISVNGHHFAQYAHRLPYHLVKEVQVRGDVTDVSCEQNIIAEYPEPACEVREILYVDDTNQVLAEEEKNNFPVPYYGKLKLPFDTSHELHINGRLKMLPVSFYINLQDTSKIWPHAKIHFHFNPRFNSTEDGKHILVCNSWLDGDWGQEERCEITRKEFYPSRAIQLRFKRTYNSYLVYMNNALWNEFRFRDDGRMQPDVVYIQGDFVIREIFVSNSYEEYPVEEE